MYDSKKIRSTDYLMMGINQLFFVPDIRMIRLA